VGITDLVRRALRATRGGRRVSVGARRASMRVRGLDDERGRAVVQHVEAAIRSVPGVAWAYVVPALGRVVVGLEEGEPMDIGDLVSSVEAAERRAGAQDAGYSERPDHPADVEPLVREGTAVVADAAAIGVAVAGRLAHLARLPMEVAGLVPLVQSQPRLRRAVESAIGTAPADAVLAAGSAVIQALAQGPFGLAVDLGQRLTLVAEQAARRDLWEEWANRALPSETVAPLVDTVGPRAVPLPAGPVERNADRAAAASVGVLAATTLALGSFRRGLAAVLAFTPKGASFGREVFAALLGRDLARRGVLYIDATALRRLDRLDTVVLDGRLEVAPFVGAAHESDLRVVVAGGDAEAADRAGADDWSDGRDGTAAVIRRLQANGSSVACVTGDRPGLMAADCGIGLGDVGQVPWEADLLCPDRRHACYVLEAVGTARDLSRQSVALSWGASGAGTALSILSEPASAARNANNAVNTGAALAMVNGVRAAAVLGRRPLPPVGAQTMWHELGVGEVLARLHSTANGLTAQEAAAAAARRAETGADHAISFPAAIVEEMANPITPVLAVAAAVSGAAGSLADAGLVSSVVLANGVLGGVQRYRVEHAVRALEGIDGALVSVRREGRWSTCAPQALVVGDVVRFQAGDWVPADCRILASRALEVEQASLTGESAPVPKGPAASAARSLANRSSMLYEGSSIAAGRARAVVVAVAPDTELRRAAEGVTPPPTGVEVRLRDLTRLTIPLALGGGAALLGNSVLRGLTVRQGVGGGVSLAVAAVPEGLPLLATMAQLAGARRLSRRGALVRNPRALEALGRVEVLCCDKTGTLTEGRITLDAVHDGTRLRSLAHLGARHRNVLAAAVRASPAARTDGGALPHLTDRAVVEGAYRCGIGTEDGIAGWEKVAELPFEPARGYHAVLGRTTTGQLLSVKGAPEVVLPRCTRWRHRNDSPELDDRARQGLARTVERMGRRSYRLLAVAERSASGRADLDDERVQRLDLLGFVALVDPVRPAGAAAVASLQRAGISVVMLTGDHRSTAEGVAVELGVLNNRRVLTGPELDLLSDPELDAILDDVAVFARVTPSHKMRLVAAYQRRGQAVAMTGDGANDAPAIGLADAGVALGPQATPAARAAADVVVPDGRIETLVDAIVEGRALWSSVRDAIAILVGGNLGEIAFTVLASLPSGRPPLSPRQLLLVNLLTDIAPALAIAVRPPSVPPGRLLSEGPDTSLGRPLERAIIARAVATTGGATAAWVGGRLTGRPARASTIALVGLVGSQLGQTLRTDARNPAVLAASLGSAAALGAIVQTPGVSHFFGCRPLGPGDWGIALGAAATATAGSDLSERLVSLLPRLRPVTPSPGQEPSPEQVLAPAPAKEPARPRRRPPGPRPRRPTRTPARAAAGTQGRGPDRSRQPTGTPASEPAGAPVRAAPRMPARGAAGPRSRARRGPTRSRGPTRDELYERARALGVPGRSRMTKRQLRDALAVHPARPGRRPG
jgi:cation-transporting P-type ATPase I